MKEKEKISPAELVLNVENLYDNHATFLDIEVDVEGDQFKTKTYDKRENYKFEIVNFPDLSGNIPHGAANGVYTSQVIRYARVCNKADDFKERIKLLIIKGFSIQFSFNSIQNSLLLHTVQIWILHSLIIQTTATKNKTWIEQPLVCSPYNNDINVDIWYRGTIELFNQSVQFSILTHIKKWDMYYMKQREREAQYELMCPKSV